MFLAYVFIYVSKYIYRFGQLLNQQLPTVKRTEQSYSQCFFSASESQSSHVRFLISTPLTFLSAILCNRPVNDTIVLIERKNSKGEQKINWLNVKGNANGFLTFNNYHYYHVIESISETTFFIVFSTPIGIYETAINDDKKCLHRDLDNCLVSLVK